MRQQPRITRYRTPLAVLLSALLALAGIVAIAAPAQAAVTDITGTVTSTDGSPVPLGTNIYLSAEISNGGAGPSGPMFPSAVPVTTTGAGGSYTITGVPQGYYLVLADAGDDWVQGFSPAILDGVTDPGAVADIEIEKGVLITGTVRPESNPAATLGGIAVGALLDCGCGGLYGDGTYFDILTFDWDVAYPQTPASGVYRIVVPLGGSYEVSALDPSATPLYADQSWDHLSGTGGCGCGDFTPITTPDDTVATPWPYSPYGPTSAIDFDLRAYSDYLWFQVQTVHAPGTTPYPNVHVFLQFDATPGGWTDVDDAVTDSGGYADLFATDDGDYRLRFEIGGVQVAVLNAVDAFACGCATAYPLSGGNTRVELGSYVKSLPGDGYFEGADAQVTLKAPASGGGGTPAPPAPRTPTHTGYPPIVDLSSLTATPTPTPTPTSSPTPSSSPTVAPSPSPTPTGPPAENTGFDILSLWWLLLLLLILGIVVLVIVLVRRR